MVKEHPTAVPGLLIRTVTVMKSNGSSLSIGPHTVMVGTLLFGIHSTRYKIVKESNTLMLCFHQSI